MSKPKAANSKILLNPEAYDQIRFSEYITAIAWSPDGKTLGVATAAGEVAIMPPVIAPKQTLQAPNDLAVDCLEFSADGRWLAAAGQSGKIQVWDLTANPDAIADPVATIDVGNTWIEHLRWHPTRPEFAFGLGKYVQVWSADTLDIVTTLHFEQSTVLAIAWHPSGAYLTVGGDQGIKHWHSADWYADPIIFELPTATTQLVWSASGQYLASSTLDNLVLILQWLDSDFDPSPWRMQGFPGKIRSLAWSTHPSPLLASSSGTDIVIWQLDADNAVIGWEGEVLNGHGNIVGQVAFDSSANYLASADANGRIAIWRSKGTWLQALETPLDAITAMQWQPKGKKLAAANDNGDFMIWHESSQGKGFR